MATVAGPGASAPPDPEFQPSEAAAAASPAASAPPGRGVFVRSMILVTALLVIGMVGVLFYRWVNGKEPNSVLIIAATPAFEGTQVTIEGVDIPQPFHATIKGADGYKLPFFVNRGSYRVRLERDGKQFFESEVMLTSGQGRQLDLKYLENLLPPPSATEPSETQGLDGQ